LLVALFTVTAAAEIEFQDFLQRLKVVYSTLQDLQATVTIKRLTAEGKEEEVGRVRIGTLVKGRVLRVEFLEPAEMRGQILALKGYQLYQYLPVINTIYVQEITEKHMYYPLLEFLNLDLEEIVARLQEEGFSLTISQRIVPLAPTAELELVNTISQLAKGYSAAPPPLELSLALLGMGDLPLGFRISAWQLGDYLLEATSSRPGLESRELIWIDPLSLIPRRIENYERRSDGRVREEVKIYLISDAQINRGLTEEELLAMPKDAKIRYAQPPK